MFSLRCQVSYFKAKDYDRLAENLSGLREALETIKRSSEDMSLQLSARDNTILRLQTEYQQLREDIAAQKAADKDAILLDLFSRVRLTLVQAPSLRLAVRSGKAVTAQDILDVYALVEQVFTEVGFEKIGDAGDIVEFDPQLYAIAGPAAQSISPGDKVRIRYVGYRYNGRIVCKAEAAINLDKESTPNKAFQR